MFGFITAVREGLGFVLLVLVVVYTVKFAYFKQDPATWDSWRFDDNFFIVLPIAAGGILLFGAVCWCVKHFTCGRCRRRRRCGCSGRRCTCRNADGYSPLGKDIEMGNRS